MDEPEQDRELSGPEHELARELDAYLRRGYTPAFDPPGISKAWLAESTHDEEMDELSDSFLEAWDNLCRDPEWLDWYTTHRTLLRPADGFNYLAFEDRSDRRFRGRKDGLSMFVPIAEVRTADAVADYMRGLIVDFFTRRAQRAAVAPPPSLGPRD